MFFSHGSGPDGPPTGPLAAGGCASSEDDASASASAPHESDKAIEVFTAQYLAAAAFSMQEAHGTRGGQRGETVQGFKGSRVQGFNGSRVQGFNGRRKRRKSRRPAAPRQLVTRHSSLVMLFPCRRLSTASSPSLRALHRELALRPLAHCGRTSGSVRAPDCRARGGAGGAGCGAVAGGGGAGVGGGDLC